MSTTVIIDNKQLKFAVSNIIHKQASTRGLSVALNSKVDIEVESYKKYMNDLYILYQDAENKFKFTHTGNWNKESLTDFKMKIAKYANVISGLSDIDLRIFHDGFGASIGIREDLRKEEEIRKMIKDLSKDATREEINEKLSKLNINLVTEKDIIDKKAQFKDIIYTAFINEYINLNKLYASKEKANPVVELINSCEDYFKFFISCDPQTAANILPNFINELSTIPANYEQSGYKTSNVQFEKLLKTIQAFATKDKNDKALLKIIKECKEYNRQSHENKDYGILCSMLFLQYNNCYIDENIANIIANVKQLEQKDNATKVEKESTPTNKENINNQVESTSNETQVKTPIAENATQVATQLEKSTQPQKVVNTQTEQSIIKETTTKPKRRLSQLALDEKREKERSIKDNEYNFTKEELMEITKFFKAINRAKPGRKPGSKNKVKVQQNNEVTEIQKTIEPTEIKPLPLNENIVQNQADVSSNIEPAVQIIEKQPKESNFIQSSMKLIEELNNRFNGISDKINFTAKFEYTNGNAKLSAVQIGSFDLSDTNLEPTQKENNNSNLINAAKSMFTKLDSLISANGIDANFTATFEYNNNRLNIKNIAIQEFDLTSKEDLSKN